MYDDWFGYGNRPTYEPYTPDELLEEHSRLTTTVRQSRYGKGSTPRGDRFAVAAGVGFIGGFLLVPAVGVPTDSWLAVLGAELLLALLICLTILRPVLATSLAHRKLKALTGELTPYELSHAGPAEARRALARMGQDLKSLPPDLREELRPLWDAALTAANILHEAPGDQAALAALEERAQAVAEVRMKHAAMEAELERQASAARAQGHRSDLEAIGSSDLDLAKIYAQALEEGQQRARELAQG